MTSSGLIVIGNEVLSGKVEEENARFLIEALRKLGVTLMRIVFIRDDIETIAQDVRAMAPNLDIVMTSGGVGSTHDDVTLAAIARAFDVPLIEHPDIVEILKARYENRMNDAVRRMACLPQGAELIGKEKLKYPLIKVRNVYVFPGVPIFLRQKFEVLEETLRGEPFVLRQIFLSVSEDLIAIPLAEVDQRFQDVEFGSYPRFETQGYKVKITIESKSDAQVKAAEAELLSRLSPDWVLQVE